MQVVIRLSRTAEDLIAEFSAGAKLYLESAATEDGSYSAVGSGTAIVAGTQRYEVYDANGVPGTTWYRFRAGNSGGTTFSEYSDPWLSTSLTAYATLDAFKATVKTVSDATDAVLEGYLVSSSAFLDSQLHRRFYRDPQVSGTTSKSFRVKRSSASLTRAIGRGVDIISVTSITITMYPGATPVALEATDWELLDPDYSGHPSPDLILSDGGTYSAWSPGWVITIVGVFGFPEVPDIIARATLEIAREMHRQGAGGASAAQGVNQYGVPIFLTGYPPTVRTVLAVDSIFRNQSFAWV